MPESVCTNVSSRDNRRTYKTLYGFRPSTLAVLTNDKYRSCKVSGELQSWQFSIPIRKSIFKILDYLASLADV